MHVTYKPEGEEPRVYQFDAGRVRNGEAEQIERRAGMRYEDWALAVQQGSARARRVLLWHLLRRDHPNLRFEDTPDFYFDELVLEYDAKEIRELIDRLNEAGNAFDIGDEARERGLAFLQAELEKAEERGEQAGKAPTSQTSETATA